MKVCLTVSHPPTAFNTELQAACVHLLALRAFFSHEAAQCPLRPCKCWEQGPLHPPREARTSSPSFLPAGVPPPSSSTPRSCAGRDGEGSVLLPLSLALIAFQNPLHRLCSGMRSPDPSTLPGWEMLRGATGDLYTVLVMFSALFSLPFLPSPDPSFAFQTPLPSQFSAGLSSLMVRIRGTSRNVR